MEEKHQFEKLHAAITVKEAYFEVGRLSVELEWKYNPVLVLDGSYRGSTAYITLSVITLVVSRTVSAMDCIAYIATTIKIFTHNSYGITSEV